MIESLRFQFLCFFFCLIWFCFPIDLHPEAQDVVRVSFFWGESVCVSNFKIKKNCVVDFGGCLK